MRRGRLALVGLAVALLADGGWLANRVYRIVRSLGVPESDISTGPPTEHGESYLAADVCGSSFIVVSRDGDLTPAFARRAAEIVEERIGARRQPVQHLARRWFLEIERDALLVDVEEREGNPAEVGISRQVRLAPPVHAAFRRFDADHLGA